MGADQTLRLKDCINDVCPWSGDPVSAEALSLYRGQVVGFCNPGCRDKFEKATRLFETKLNSAQTQDKGTQRR